MQAEYIINGYKVRTMMSYVYTVAISNFKDYYLWFICYPKGRLKEIHIVKGNRVYTHERYTGKYVQLAMYICDKIEEMRCSYAN